MVDVERVAREAASMPRVVHTQDVQYLCSEVGQGAISKAIKEHGLNRIVIGACSPRMHESTFHKLLEAQGLNPYYAEIANLREQCSWVHTDKEKATLKAIDLVKKAVAKTYFAVPLFSELLPVAKRALVIGGGIAGLQAALDIAEAGYPVDLVEKLPSIGGRMAQFDKTFPTLDCSACILTPKMVDVAVHDNITIYTYAEVERVAGYVGSFKVSIRQRAKSIDHQKCNGCGDCVSKCPKKVDNEFDQGKSKRKAVYTLFPQAVPNKPVIDRTSCTYFQSGKCGLCQKICPTGAIEYGQQDQIIEGEYGAIIAATGFEMQDPRVVAEYSYGQHPDVITSLDLERMLNASGPTSGKLVRPSTGQIPKRIVFVQCVGSRERNRGNPYCSKVCCLYTAKHTLLINEKFPNTETFVFNIDVRTAGKGYEEFYERARQNGAKYLRGQVSKIEVLPDNTLLARGFESSLCEQIEVEADLVVLATSIQPQEEAKKLASLLGISCDQHGFYSEAHPKLRPVETHAQGIYLAGVCQGPKDIPESVSQASAAAAKAIILFNKGQVKSVPATAFVNRDICSGCMQCKPVCPYEAIGMEHIATKINDREVKLPVAAVNRALCQGCGACSGICRSGAMDLGGFTSKQIMAEVDAL
jgi:heterodisulfide reductase subunit A